MKVPCVLGAIMIVSTMACDGRSGRISAQPTPPVRQISLPSGFPPEIAEGIQANQDEFLRDLEGVLVSDTLGLLVLVDKAHSLDKAYEPEDLIPLVRGKVYSIGRTDMRLRIPAEIALAEMAAAAQREGIQLLVSSAYRSYAYQTTVYERNVRELGQTAADRESARPGTSQHQLGTAVDFGSITDAYAQTPAGKWLAANAGTFGWSLSFPDGYESVTGYRWECWHFRYIGRDAVRFQDKWFKGVQQYMMEFLHAWKGSASL
jgi:D-alanyl-D-alanine carboxypeptidase